MPLIQATRNYENQRFTREIMREFYEIINEYPWTTFFLFLMIVVIITIFANVIENIKK